ncbi:MAG: ParB N-terminal domain-containing protein [Candidatus Didemnitutus sp.]|nr:ParB N-terminal domain-containing protein [Candidatus Didemnitutus sp.]
MAGKIEGAFERRTVTLPLDRIMPIRPIQANDQAFGKFRAILASIREIGVIEPMVVHPQRGSRENFVLLDGHMRLRALRELGRAEAVCLVATNDDAFTYNDKISRVAPIQEHRMIMRAIEQGVTPEQIARSLDIDADRIKRSMNLLDGIHPDVVEMLKDKPITDSALRVFKKVKAMRQLDFAHLMVSMGNYTRGYAQALLIATPPDMLVKPQAPKSVKGLKPEELAQMEREMETLERDFRAHQDGYGENTLSLNVVQRFVKRLTENPQVARFLTKRYPEILEELNDLVALEAL